MFPFTIFFLALGTVSHTYTMDSTPLSPKDLPNEITNTYIIPELSLRQQIALKKTSHHFNNFIVLYTPTMHIPLPLAQYNYCTEFMTQRKINITSISLEQTNTDLTPLFTAANTAGVQEVFIDHSIHASWYPLISPLLNNNKKLQILSFAGKQIAFNVSDLCSAVRKNSSLTELRIYNTRLPGKNVRDILRTVNVATNITTLDLYGNFMMNAQLNALRTNTSLTNLGLQFCRISEDAAAQSIITFITNNTNLKILKINETSKDVYDAITPALDKLKLRNLDHQ